jgi:hypothetical protein
MQKQIKDYDNYIIYDDGIVLNLKTKKTLQGSVGENGYKYYRLSSNNNKKMFYAHRLVAEHFIPNPENLPVVNHKDGNKLNNHISNLEWVSYSKNAEHFHKYVKNSQNQKYEKYTADLENEQWVTVKSNSNYRVSSFGRVHNIKTNNILHPVETCGYYKVRLSQNGKTTDWLIHKLVFQSFHHEVDTKDYCIDHIDGNKHNNSLSNLRKITLSENVRKAYYEQRTNSNIKPVSQYSKEGEFLATFPSSREAARQLNLDSSSITKCCKGKLKTTGGFVFKYA